MNFASALQQEEPACEIFRAALDTVFDKGGGCTGHIDRLSKEARLVYLPWYRP